MTNAELADNLTFLAAEKMLKCLVKAEALTEEEAQTVRKELKRRLRPTIILICRN